LFFVPETRNVALGREMDAVFGDAKEIDEEVMEIEDSGVDERTALLGLRRERETVIGRRGSFGAYT